MMQNNTKLCDDGRLLSGIVQGFNMESVLQRAQQCGAALNQEVCSDKTRSYGLAEVRQIPSFDCLVHSKRIRCISTKQLREGRAGESHHKSGTGADMAMQHKP